MAEGNHHLAGWRPRHPRWLPAAGGEMKRRIYKPRFVGDQSRY
jgi:hypothetical protein